MLLCVLQMQVDIVLNRHLSESVKPNHGFQGALRFYKQWQNQFWVDVFLLFYKTHWHLLSGLFVQIFQE